jgi:MoxR-like ATPase
MNIAEIKTKILKFYRTDLTVPIMVVGSPGLGKSECVAQARDALAESLGETVGLVDIRASLHDPTDFAGFPHIRDGRTYFAQPAFLPREDTHPRAGILFLDELGQASPAVQAACLQLCLDRRIGEYRLPEGWMIVAASNRKEDKAGANRLITPLLDRFAYYEVEADLDTWQEWSATANVNPLIRSFLRFKPECFNTFDPKAAQTVFATPRSWVMLSKILPALDASDRMTTAQGIVGHGAAVEFEAFVLHAANLPTIEDVLADPMGTEVPERNLSVMYALVGSLAAEMASREVGNPQGEREMGQIVKYALRFAREFQVLAMREFYQVNRPVLTLDICGEWFEENSELLRGVAQHNKK